MTKPDIYQVVDDIPYLVGWHSTTICCDCSLVHDEIYSVRTNKRTGKKELWCKATRNPQETRKLRRKSSASSGTHKPRRS